MKVKLTDLTPAVQKIQKKTVAFLCGKIVSVEDEEVTSEDLGEVLAPAICTAGKTTASHKAN